MQKCEGLATLLSAVAVVLTLGATLLYMTATEGQVQTRYCVRLGAMAIKDMNGTIRCVLEVKTKPIKETIL